MENKKDIQNSTNNTPNTPETALQAAGLYNLERPQGAHKHKKLLGRGSGSGHGKTSTRGSKGQTSRAGRHFYLGFEGGQTPLIRRIPKRGFTNKSFKKSYAVINLDDLNKLKAVNITLDLLKEKGMLRGNYSLVKVLGDGSIQSPVKVQAHAFSKQAQEKIQKAGGNIEIINDRIR